MLRRLTHFLIAAGISSAVCALIFLPDWFEDPVKLAPGEWTGSVGGAKYHADVTQAGVSWNGPGSRDKATYEWLQTEDEPYRIRFIYHKHKVDADVTFNGEDEAILEPDIKDLFSPSDQAQIRKINKSRQRPEDEFKLIFHRVKGKQ